MSNKLRPYKQCKPQIKDQVYVDPSAVLIGEINVDDDVSFWPLVVVRADVNKITIGARTNVQDGSVLHVTRKSANFPEGFPLSIGSDVTIGHKVMLHGCTLKNRILVGMGAIVMDGAIVENDVIIGAGSLVPPNKTLESGYLYVGNPAQKRRKLTEDELAFLPKTAANYVELKNDYLAMSK
ncbi:gamma carbonic anhydrase family protein [Thalassotalea aquiviva]|uniref:gamma carbonic anhydrase family protein n=1 Tax=Thalassotalea aquiviva TaxID=3242415 RepID=UPI00352A600F